MRTSLSLRVERLDGLAREQRDVAHEVLARLLAVLDLAEPLLPVAGQARRGQRVLVEQPDHVQALLGGDQRAAVALDVADVDQALDDRGARGGRADAGVLHGLAQLVVVDELARGLHRGQQRRVGVAARRLGDLLLRGDLARVDGLAALELRELLRAALVVVGGRLRTRGERLLAVDAAPAGHEQDAAGRAEDVRLDGRLQARVLEHGLGMEDGEEAAGDHVVDPPVVVGHLVELVVRVGRDDRVVVGDLRVVDHPVGREHVEPGHVRGRLGVLAVLADVAGDRLDLAAHVRGQEARVRTRVGERLVLLVEPLRRRERAPRGEAVPRVRLALERREVVQQRRLLGALGRLELGDLAGLAAHRGDDRLGLRGGLQPRLGAGEVATGVAPRPDSPPWGSKRASTSQ